MLYQQFQKVNQLVVDQIVRTTAIKNAKKNPELDELIELQAEHYELLNNDFIRFGALYRNQILNYSLLES